MCSRRRCALSVRLPPCWGSLIKSPSPQPAVAWWIVRGAAPNVSPLPAARLSRLLRLLPLNPSPHHHQPQRPALHSILRCSGPGFSKYRAISFSQTKAPTLRLYSRKAKRPRRCPTTPLGKTRHPPLRRTSHCPSHLPACSPRGTSAKLPLGTRQAHPAIPSIFRFPRLGAHPEQGTIYGQPSA